MILSNKYRLLDKIGKNNTNCYWVTLLKDRLSQNEYMKSSIFQNSN